MASITTELTQIAESVYGRQIRGAIHDALQKVNTELESTSASESSTEAEVASEVTRLEGEIASEATRLEGVISSTESSLQTSISGVNTTATAAQTEVTGIRTRADGVVESSAANAVKAQFLQARAVEKAVYEEIVDASLWTPAYYKATDGTRGNSSVMLANASDTYLPESWGLITVDPAQDQLIGIRLFGWDSSGTFAGAWNPNTKTWGSSLSRGSQPVRVNLDEIRAMYPGYAFKLCVTGNSSDFAMTSAAYGDHIHVFDKVASAQQPKTIEWLWTIGDISTSDGSPTSSSSRQRSGFIPVGAGTKLFVNAAHTAMWVFAYNKNWAFQSVLSMKGWMNRYTARHDGFIRVVLRTASGEISDVGTLGALLSCVDYVPPSFSLSEKLLQFDWIPSGLSDGVPNGNSSKGLSTYSVHYAGNTLCVRMDPALYHVTVAFFANDKTTLLRQIGGTTEGMVCIPKGMFYRLSINAVPAATVAPTLVEAYDIFALDSLLWYGTTSGVGTVAIFQRSDTLITPEIQYSGRGLTVRCTDPRYQIRWIGYDSADPYSGLRRTVGLSNAAKITPDSYYRLILEYSGDGVPSVADAEAQLVWERAEDVDPGIATAGIASLLTVDHGEVPSYYVEHMEAKAATINERRTDTRVQFAFITDYHINAYTNRGGQTGNSGALLKYLADNTMVDMCVNGGDVANGLDGWIGASYSAQFRALERNGAAALRVPGMITYFVAGNHEGGTYGGANRAKLITEEELYMTCGLQALRGHVVVDQICPLQYYWDDTVHNVRYIVGALGLNNSAGTNAGTIVTTQTAEEAFRFIAAALRSAPAGCGIVIFNHELIQTENPTTPYTHTTYLGGLADAYNARNANYTVSTYTTTLSDFSACTGIVLAIIGGHSHFDYSYTTTGGIPVIVTTTDCAGGQFKLSGSTASSSPRPTGTINEQAFDVFTIEPSTGKIWATRIGGGSGEDGVGADRTWNV